MVLVACFDVVRVVNWTEWPDDVTEQNTTASDGR